MDVCVTIPAYQPTTALVKLVRELSKEDLLAIILVDDGSSPEHRPIFEAASAERKVHLLRHAVNLGKGAALKTAMNFALCNYPSATGIVTADADGQHAAQDVIAVARALTSDPDRIILGARRFRGSIPLRCFLGNTITRFLFGLLVGVRLRDTQTGLRGIPMHFLPQLLKLTTTGYEFELDMLIAAKHAGLRLTEVPIQTIYEPGNVTSHFNPLRDSMRIYFVLFRFTLSSLATAVLDNLLFLLTYSTGSGILRSQAAARAGAIAFNYLLVKRYVFLSRQKHATTLPKYLAVVALGGLLSYALIMLLHHTFGIAVITAKIAAESTLFMISFVLQRDFVFSRRSTTGATDWDLYYTRVPWTARLSRHYTTGALLAYLERFTERRKGMSIAELGGGNSCFLEPIQSRFQPSAYHVVDNSTYALRLLAARAAQLQGVFVHHADVLDLALPWAADVVFSVGLIEHFSPEGTARAIEAHFRQVRPGGLVILSFPTPTWLYRVTRAVLEFLGLWAFPDERPLQEQEVLATVKRFGTPLGAKTLWPLLLTQRMVAARAREASSHNEVKRPIGGETKVVSPTEKA